MKVICPCKKPCNCVAEMTRNMNKDIQIWAQLKIDNPAEWNRMFGVPDNGKLPLKRRWRIFMAKYFKICV